MNFSTTIAWTSTKSLVTPVPWSRPYWVSETRLCKAWPVSCNSVSTSNSLRRQGLSLLGLPTLSRTAEVG